MRKIAAEISAASISIQVCYDDLKGNPHVGRFKASVADPEGFQRIGEQPEYVAAEALNGIIETWRNWNAGFKRLKVKFITTAEQRKMDEEIYVAHMRRRQERNDGRKSE